MQLPGNRLVFHRGCIVRIVRPLADIHAMRPPFQAATAHEASALLKMKSAEKLLVEGPPRGGSEVKIPIDFLPIRLGLLLEPPAGFRAEPAGMGMQRLHFAKLAALCQVHRKGKVRQAAPLCAGLKHPPGATKGSGQLEAFTNRFCAWLLGVNVFPGVGGRHRGQPLPVRTGSDQHRVNVRPGQEFAQVPIHPAVLVPVLCIGALLYGLSPLFLHVANSHELNVGLFQETAEHITAPAANANGPQNDLLARRHAPAAQHHAWNYLWDTENGAGFQRRLEELPSAAERFSHAPFRTADERPSSTASTQNPDHQETARNAAESQFMHASRHQPQS